MHMLFAAAAQPCLPPPALQGAEVVRLYYTLLGPEAFARGLSSFFDTYHMQVMRHMMCAD
jgi:hypothetical protein